MFKLLTGTLGIFSALVCAQGIASMPVKRMVDLEKRQALRSHKNQATREESRRKAEAAAREAAKLRQRQTEADFKAAIRLFQVSVGFYTSAHLYSKAVDAKLQIAEIYFTLSQYGRALSSYQEAGNLGGKDTAQSCLVLSRIARTYATMGQQSDADRFSMQTIRRCDAVGNPKIQAEVSEARGEVLYNSGELSEIEESAKLFNRAQELFAESKDESGRTHALLMLAYARFRDDRAEAVQIAGKALQLSSSITDLHGVAEARTALGTFASVTDDFETAQCNYERSLPVFHRMGDKDNEAIALNGIGYASMRRGDVESSLENFNRAKAIFVGVHDQLGAGEAIAGVTQALSAMRRYQPLLVLYKMRLRLAQQTHNIYQQASLLADLAGVYEQQHEYRKANVLYQRSLQAYISAKRNDGVGDIFVRLALLDERRGEDLQALNFLEKAQDLKDKTGEIEDVARIYYEQANIYRRLNRLQDARTTIEKTIKIIESQRLKIAKFDSRAAYFSSVHKYYALDVQILMLLDLQDPKGGLGRLAFEASEKGKVRALLDLLDATKEDSPCDDLLRGQLAPTHSTENQPELKHAGAASPVLTLEQIQAEIGENDTLLEFALGDKKSYAWLVGQSQIISYELPPADKIGERVRAFHDALTAREDHVGEGLDEHKGRVRTADLVYPRLARQLSEMLLGQINLSAVKRLLIVPDGPLQYIPFSALPVSQNGKQSEPLIRDHEVVVLPSASALGTLRKAAEKKSPPTRTAVIIADPVFGDDDPRLPWPRSSTRNKSRERGDSYMARALRDVRAPEHIARLLGSGAEAEAIRRILDSSDVLVQRGFDATRDSVLQGSLEPYRIIHFATHGIIDAQNPEMSGLILSLRNERGRPQEGYLRLGDIYRLKLSADLVVLSACDSALGKDLVSEGTIGLPRGFLYAGGRSVIASLWKVDDDAAAAFMRDLYARLHKHESPSSALRGAQLEMSQGKYGKEWGKPFYWATFVLQGDYK